MEAVPLIPKGKVLPNVDAAPLIKELFQDEFQAVVPTKKLSQNILTSLQHEKANEDDEEIHKSVEFLGSLSDGKERVTEFTENVLEAYRRHSRNLQEIRKAEEHLFEARAKYLKRELIIAEDKTVQDLLKLKRQPLYKALDVNHVKKYQLLQGVPPEYELNSDFRVRNFKQWRNRVESISQDSLIMNRERREIEDAANCKKQPKKEILPQLPKKVKKPRPKAEIVKRKQTEVLKAEPKMVFFTNFILGDAYITEIKVKNVHTKGVRFQLKPMSVDGPFRVMLNEKYSTTLSPGLSFLLNVEFVPKSLDNAVEDIIIATEDGTRLLIPLIAYLEPPVLKTHKEVDELTKSTSERITSSYIECGTCFTGDIKVTKLKFRCYQGSGEFFIMSSENWSRSHIDTLTVENLLEIPPFRVYPAYFKIEKDQVIDLFVEFVPRNSGMHVENIIIACDNGQIRSLDLLGDAVGWHGYYFSFQDSLLKELSVEQDDDVKVKYYLNFDDVTGNGKVEKLFLVSNNSNMAFEFQWKIREANIVSSRQKYQKLLNTEVKIDPESGTFEPNSIWEFLVTITLNKKDMGNYRMVLSLYVLNLPYQCIEEDNTIIQPTGLVRNLYSQSLYGEEDGSALSPELASLQGTYESLQESIKSYVECQSKAQAAPKYDFCKTTCIPNPGLCAKPLKKSKTYFNIGEDEGLGCACRMKQLEPESNSESCTSNARDEKINEIPAQKNEIIWDFVDVLVDEVELWVEVVPTRVTLEPSVIELSSPLKTNDPPVCKKIRIINHNHCSVTCTWLLPSELSSTKNNSSGFPKAEQTSFSLLFDKKSGKKNQGTINDSARGKINREPNRQSSLEREETETCVMSSQWKKEAVKTSEICQTSIKPNKTFLMSGLYEFVCEIGISACRAGKIRETLYLNVNDGELRLELLILGTAVAKSFETSPDILDFGMLRQGTRYNNYFSIVNENSSPLSWRIKEFKFNFKEEQFLNDSEVKDSGSIKTREGVLAKKGDSTTECYSMDARVSGIKCSLLEIVGNDTYPEKQYVLVLGDVKTPNLSISSPRFASAILAPPGTMYVGQKTSTKVTLTNTSKVETFVTWGYPFGCHSRKIKAEISPRSCRIEKEKKLTVSIDLTALDEGIVSHYYIPCFFCRSTEPLILSVVGIVKNVNVTFEIINFPSRTHADHNAFLKSPIHHTMFRIPWPRNMYDPTLALKYINERDILNMKCHCQEVEEEANRVFGEPKADLVPEPAVSKRSIQSLEISDKDSQKSKNTPEKSNQSGDVRPSASNTSALGALDSKTSEECSTTLSTYVEFAMDSQVLRKPQLEFLNVPYQTPILKQFVIRNETPISTTFQINVLNYGVPKNLPDKRLETIKSRVLGHSTDDFQNKLMKNQPLVVTVEPSGGELKPFDAVCIDVHCYGNTWGEYRDALICQVKGIEAYHLKMMIQIVGHPIFFPIFKTGMSEKPIIRFQSLSCIENPASKQLKVVNRSSIPLNILWMVFLTHPCTKDEEKEDSFNLCVNSSANFDSNHSREESVESSKNYIPKNTSGSASAFPNMLDMKDFSQYSDTIKSFAKTELSPSSSLVKKDKSETEDVEKKSSIIFFGEESKSDMQQLLYWNRPHIKIFQVEPKEMFFEAFEEKKLTVIFNPSSYKPEAFPQEFKAVLTGCVKLKPEDEKHPQLYYRPCGINFVSEVMDFSASVEVPFLSFEIRKGDLKFIVDSNAVVKSQSKSHLTLRKFLIKNTNEKTLSPKIKVVPGVIFHVEKVNSLDKFYPKYNPDVHELKIESGHALEIELQCKVTYKDIIYAFEQLKLSKKKMQKCPVSVEEIKTMQPNKGEEERQREKEPWQYLDNSLVKRTVTDNRNLGHRDSFEINLNRMSSKSGSSLCGDDYKRTRYFGECEGEFFELPKAEIPCRPKPPEHVTVIKEEINFVQSGLISQSLVAELHISFPAIKISPKSLDFGNVYLGETGLRYCSLINLTGFSTDFRVTATSKVAEFAARPLAGNLPSTNYNSDTGKTIEIEFKPSEPGYFKEVFRVYCNSDLEFEFFELFVSGFGTWNEKYRSVKFDTYTKLEGIYPNLQM